MSSLKLNGVTKTYPSGVRALYNTDLETSDKEFLVILGGEESGKSTLLRVIAGLEDCTAGKILIDGKEMNEVEPKDRDIAMVFRGDALYPALTVYDNLAFGLKIRKAQQSLIEQRVKAVSSILGLDGVLFRKPKALTAMQKQLVALGRAVVREPKLYLFDEPLAGLDSNLKATVLNVIINMQARMQGTFVYATKNVGEAMTAGTRIAVFKKGVLQQTDIPANIYDYPANAYVAFLAGAPSINFLNDARLERRDGEVYVKEGGFEAPLPENILSRFENVETYIAEGKSVIVGIRPEDMVAGDEGFEATVGKVENDGEKVFAECEFSGNNFVVSASGGLKTGDKTKLKIDFTRLYLFDKETRLTLLKRDGGYIKTGYADAEYVPPAYAEEEEIIKNSKPAKKEKKKR